MNLLEDLIKIKKSAGEDDLIKMMDELIVYQKLSEDESLGDLKTSEFTRKKCPLLAGFADGNLYEVILADLAANIYLQIEGYIPPILLGAAEQNEKRRRQREILQRGIAQVHYRDLIGYNHETMEDRVVAVFTKESGAFTTIAVIVRDTDGYVMFHGMYGSDLNKRSGVVRIPAPAIKSHGDKSLMLKNYSMLGNNGYWFATYVTKEVSMDVMLGPDYVLYMRNGIAEQAYEIPWEVRNRMAMSKKKWDLFAEELLQFIESVVKTA